ncbi:MAG: hypothetical protein GY788_31335 [bacterium]|nr:hypothetical protein [bacterium]
MVAETKQVQRHARRDGFCLHLLFQRTGPGDDHVYAQAIGAKLRHCIDDIEGALERYKPAGEEYRPVIRCGAQFVAQ